MCKVRSGLLSPQAALAWEEWGCTHRNTWLGLVLLPLASGLLLHSLTGYIAGAQPAPVCMVTFQTHIFWKIGITLDNDHIIGRFKDLLAPFLMTNMILALDSHNLWYFLDFEHSGSSTPLFKCMGRVWGKPQRRTSLTWCLSEIWVCVSASTFIAISVSEIQVMYYIKENIHLKKSHDPLFLLLFYSYFCVRDSNTHKKECLLNKIFLHLHSHLTAL